MNTTLPDASRRAGRLPLRPPFFYGWLVVGVAMMAGFVAAGGSQVFFGVMSRPISDEFGWSRTATAGAVTAGTFLGAALTPVAGHLADRHGPRLLMSVGAVVVAAGFLGLAQVQELWQFYLAYLVTRGVSTLTLTGVVPMTAVANWFSRRRGRALGMITMAFPVANALLASGAQQVMLRGSWRTVFLGVGAAMAVLVAPSAAVIMRRRPEDVGLLPDGGPGEAGRAGQRPRKAPHSTSGYDFTLKEAMRTRPLWLMVAAQSIASLAAGTTAFHLSSHVIDGGFSPVLAAACITAYSGAGAFSSALWGYLSERFSEKALAIMLSTGAALALVLVVTAGSAATVLAASLAYGVTARNEYSLLNLLIAGYYGRRSYGAITGLIGPFSMVALGVAPLVGAVAHDLAGSYSKLFIGLMALHLTTAALLSLVHPPRPPDRAAVPDRLPQTTSDAR